MTYYSCPTCQSEHLERCFMASLTIMLPLDMAKELSGYSWHCLDCEWRGLSADRYREPNDFNERPFEREPFTDWPNGQGTYD